MSKVALIFGATGIVGSALAEELSKNHSPQEWKKIIISSRKQPILEVKDDRIHFVSLDLEKEEDEIKKTLIAAGAQDTTHMFFTAYIHSKTWDGVELSKRNTPIFEKALRAVDAIALNLERVLLQTGMKYYGPHIGPLKNTPVDENSGRHRDVPGNPDFYFIQEDFLIEQQKGKKWTYTTYRPSHIVGVTRGNGMSIAPTLALYFLVQKELGKKALFPGNVNSYKGVCDFSNAEIIAQFAIWLATLPQAKNEHFNIIDNNYPVRQTWEQVWRKIGEYFGVEIDEPTFEKSNKNKDDVSVILNQEYLLEQYMADKQDVWKRFVKKNGGEEDMWNYATWDFADIIMGLNYPNGEYSLSKAVKLGWKNEITTTDGFVQVFDKLKRLGMTPSK